MATRRVTLSDEDRAALAAIDESESMDILPPRNQIEKTADENSEESETQDFTTRMRAVLAAASGNDGVKVRLYRKDKHTGELGFCANYTPEQFESGDMEMIRTEWGPGSYQMRVIGKKGILTRGDFKIEESARTNAFTAVPNNPPSSNIDKLQEILLMMHQQNQQQSLAILTALDKRPDPFEQMAKFAEIMKAINPPSVVNSQPQMSASQQLREALELNEMLKKATTVEPPKETDGLLEMVPSVLGIVKEAMQSRTPSNVGNQIVPMISTPVSISQTSKTEQTQQIQSEENDDNMNKLTVIVLKGYLKALINMAASNQSPEKGAALIYEKLPDDMIDFLDLPNWFEALEQIEPTIIPHKEWMTKARDLAIIEFNKPDEEEKDA